MSEDRIAALEARLGALEDERDIARTMASYGPLVDGGDADGVAALWAPDGVYDIDEIFLAGRERIVEMVRSPRTRAGSGRAAPMSWARPTSRWTATRPSRCAIR